MAEKIELNQKYKEKVEKEKEYRRKIAKFEHEIDYTKCKWIMRDTT